MLMRLSVGSCLCVGDQLFTDIYGANRSNIHTILVNPIDPHEEIQIVLKRRLEAIVLHFYKKKLAKEGRTWPEKR
jgi:predicted HAD superfamily phosphohydrolase YqeG